MEQLWRLLGVGGTVGGRCTPGTPGNGWCKPRAGTGKAAPRSRAGLLRGTVVAPRPSVVWLRSCKRGHLGAGGVTAVQGGARGCAPCSAAGQGPARVLQGRGAPRNPSRSRGARSSRRPAAFPAFSHSPSLGLEPASNGAESGRPGAEARGHSGVWDASSHGLPGLRSAQLPAELAGSERIRGRGLPGNGGSRGSPERGKWSTREGGRGRQVGARRGSLRPDPAQGAQMLVTPSPAPIVVWIKAPLPGREGGTKMG